ncbi:uncharacterized protein LOC100893752 [Strongylocentrotus purpuratus]|uniref:Uncharacterized protein n=1 Tax=Strongylocentrotus purpuratus TaxID=7668 RepID=A0A7M7LLJ1_STRPU|nr:uncharacterized protein LOC100893752 [Strongylocentrotus purpuratus]|eukprot:XP_003728498.1 PREDICTED: uncharacterized protein LOC100893752 [Strongylocentrotus purpuratus]
MRIRHFMDNKPVGRDESIRAATVRSLYDGTEMSRDENAQTTSQHEFASRENRCNESDNFSLPEVNANAPLSTSTVDDDRYAYALRTRLTGDQERRRATRHDAGDGIAGGHPTIEFDLRRRNGGEEVDMLCHSFAGIDEDDYVRAASDSEPQGNERDDILMGACSSSCSSISDCGMATTGVISTSSTRRTLGQIRESLEQKVKRLRAEKEAVDEKIRLAQEEEEIRMREKIKIRGKVIMQRKDRLRKLVCDLKGQLDDHSQRLQNAYSTLLLLQRTIFRSRSFCRSRRIKQRPGLAEAPF